MKPNTLKVWIQGHPLNPVIINETDFDPKTMSKEAQAPKKRTTKKLATTKE